ncbi:glutathione S-transferase N-terminal domain-containing protein [Stakelama sp. CBK3Z-3]|uniref:Glutathione S-transferase N-terminal domain-containing protein n=1 Tax=Stakelama flava TaxID=2860338 RepID=A0ABS6XPJ5_9SPHN|nr:glutathione S-transferase N-terminal domain-containing protein [Stakelama flava]MBW4332138.1 glutathione S-transferase N-terminal domain-containing protein [Stakelama flava]
MSEHFRPALYLKATCPHCLKLRIFLLETGLAETCELKVFTPGDAAEAGIRDELARRFDKTTFPAARIAQKEYMKESDAIIERLAQQAGIDPTDLPVFQAYAGSVLPRYQAARRELRQLKEG